MFGRLRRLRLHPGIRDMVRETRLSVENLVYPLFVVHGSNVREPIASLPGCFHLSVDQLVEEARRARDLGIPAVIIFGLPEAKDATGSEAYAFDGITQQAFRALKQACSDLVLIGDVCLCQYTDHGHCGLLDGSCVDNDATIELLAKTAVTQAEAGADMVAPSDMMDGRVLAIREALDGAGFPNLPIMSYAAKYASAFYGPFREAAHSTPQFGDRKSYQMDPANAEMALREVALDLEEGADIVMVKPALPYLDIISRVRVEFAVPVAAYNVSGEYAMVKAAAAAGLIDETAVMLEMLLSIRRAGASMILTYFAMEAARELGNWG
jgi:porphobilinogen synthase